MIIDGAVAATIIREDPTFAPFKRHDGSLLLRLDGALYGCIDAAKL